MLNDPIGKREPRLFICSIHDPALAIAEDAPSCAIEHDLVNFVRLRGGNVKSILLIDFVSGGAALAQTPSPNEKKTNGAN